MEKLTFTLFVWPYRWLLLGPAFAADYHRHHAAQLSIGLDGPLRMRTDQREAWSVRDAFYVPPDLPHEFDAGESRAAFLYLCPEATECRRLCNELGNDGITSPALPPEAVARLPALLQDNAPAHRAQQAIAELLGDRTAQQQRRLDPRLQRVLDHIDQHLADPLHLATLARHAAVSESWLSHTFSRSIGIPLRRYLLWRRLRRAIETALQGCSLTEAAHAAGFADSAHLSRTFRMTFGVKPTFLFDDRMALQVTDCTEEFLQPASAP